MLFTLLEFIINQFKMGYYKIITYLLGLPEYILSLSYTPMQIIVLLSVISIAIGVVMFFSTLWSVERRKNEGEPIDRMGIAFGINDQSPPTIRIRRPDRKTKVYSDLTGVVIDKMRYSYEIPYMIILRFSIGNRHYVLDHVISEKVVSNKIVMVGEYSCGASLHEDIVDTPYDVTIEYPTNIIGSLNPMYTDELHRLYTRSSIDLSPPLNTEYGDHLQSDLQSLIDSVPGVIDLQTGVRSLIFILCYKILDPGFRSVGLKSIQDLTILMSIHIEMLRMAQLSHLFGDEEDEEVRSYMVDFATSIVTIEDAIRRFVTKNITSQKRRADIFDILNRYTMSLRDVGKSIPLDQNKMEYLDLTTLLENDNDPDSLKKIRHYLDADFKTVALACKMYGEILIKIADPDSHLYDEEVSRLYALLAPLYSFDMTNIVVQVQSINDDIYGIIMNRYLRRIHQAITTSKIDDLIYPLINDIEETDMPNTQGITRGVQEIIQKVWETHGLSRRAINSGNQDTYALLKSV